jgi:hypothetical protein
MGGVGSEGVAAAESGWDSRHVVAVEFTLDQSTGSSERL